MGLPKGLRRELNRMEMRMSMPTSTMSPEKWERWWEAMKNDNKPYRPAKKHPFKRIK